MKLIYLFYKLNFKKYKKDYFLIFISILVSELIVLILLHILKNLLISCEEYNSLFQYIHNRLNAILILIIITEIAFLIGVITRIVRMMKLDYFMIKIKGNDMKHICLLISMQATVVISMTIFMGMVYKLFQKLILKYLVF